MKAGGDRAKKFAQDKLTGRNADDDVVWEKVKAVPKLGKPMACFVCFINILIPGFGTIIGACSTAESKVSKT